MDREQSQIGIFSPKDLFFLHACVASSEYHDQIHILGVLEGLDPVFRDGRIQLDSDPGNLQPDPRPSASGLMLDLTRTIDSKLCVSALQTLALHGYICYI